MKGIFKFVLLIAAILFTFFILAKDLVETKAKLRKSQEQVAQEQLEKLEFKDRVTEVNRALDEVQGALAQERKEKEELHGKLRETQEKLVKTEESLQEARNNLRSVTKKMTILGNNNLELKQAKNEIEKKLSLLNQEKQAIEARLHSLSELKKATHEVKIEIRQKKIETFKENDSKKLAEGNRGFLVRDKKVYFKPKVNIEVRPAD